VPIACKSPLSVSLEQLANDPNCNVERINLAKVRVVLQVHPISRSRSIDGIFEKIPQERSKIARENQIRRFKIHIYSDKFQNNIGFFTEQIEGAFV
jgi:hypothetical protein